MKALRPISKSVSMFAVLTAVFCLCGCRTSTITSGVPLDPQKNAQAPTIAIVPFENLTAHRQAGLAVTDLATTVLHAQKHYRVIEVSALQSQSQIQYRKLEVSPWERQVGLNTDTAIGIGKQMKADYVLAGSVGEYGFVDGFGQTANVALNLRLVHVTDGAIAWVGSQSTRVACMICDEESVHRLAHEVTKSLLDRMVWELQDPGKRPKNEETSHAAPKSLNLK